LKGERLPRRRAVFSYKLFRDQPAPLITLGVKIDNHWYPLEVYVDSGAAYTILHAGIADGIGFNYQNGRREFLRVADGRVIPVYLHELEIQLGSARVKAPVGFSNQLGVGFNLLGRKGIFERFKICFVEKQRTLLFESL